MFLQPQGPHTLRCGALRKRGAMKATRRWHLTRSVRLLAVTSCSCSFRFARPAPRVAFGARAQPGALQRQRRKLRVDACLVLAIEVVEALGIAAEELHVRDHVARVGLLFALL